LLASPRQLDKAPVAFALKARMSQLVCAAVAIVAELAL
jgi:hypothetical protein